MQQPILLSPALWAKYSEFVQLWKGNGRKPLPVSVCVGRGIANGTLGALRAAGVVCYTQHLGGWSPALGVRVDALIPDGPPTADRKMGRPKGSGRKDVKSLRLPRLLVREIEFRAKAQGQTFSDWLRDAAQRKIEEAL